MSNSSNVKSAASPASAFSEPPDGGFGRFAASARAASAVVPSSFATSSTVACEIPEHTCEIVLAAATRVSHCLFFKRYRICGGGGDRERRARERVRGVVRERRGWISDGDAMTERN
eukprot:20671-Pelagococcus_subviridis.AAC.2